MFTNTHSLQTKISATTSAVPSRTARLSALLLLSGVFACAQVASPVVVGYYMESTTFPPSTLVTNGSLARLTHLNYAFADIKDTITNANTTPPTHAYSCVLHDPAGETGANGTLQKLKALKTSNPNLKILISIGGALGSGNFTNAADDVHRDAFAQSCVNMFIDGGYATPKVTGLFDGIDIDWEFPKSAADAADYTKLLAAFRTKLDTYKTNHPAVLQQLLVTSAISPNNGPDWQLQNIDFSSTGATQYVNFFNVMTYDYAGSWNTSPISTAPYSSIIVNIPNLIGQGIPPSKIVLGVPFYGVHYAGNFKGDTTGTPLSTLLSQAAAVSNGPVQTPATANSGPATQDTDYESIVTQTLDTSAGTTNLNVSVAHDSDGSAWAFDSKNLLLWVYDDATTIKQKAVWARGQNLAGMMTWELGKDTAAGTLLCAMEGAINNIAGTVCTPAGVTPPPPPPTMMFDFETGVTGWAVTPGVHSVSSSTVEASTGTHSMAVNFIASGTFQAKGTVWAAPPAAVKAGSTVTFSIWVSSAALTNLTGIEPFFMDKNWTWTSTIVNLSKLTPNAWNKVSVVVPANAVIPFTEIGIEFDSSKLWAGTIYVDSVTVQ